MGGDAADRARGALVGLAVGDAVGTTLEFLPPGSFEPIDDLVGGGPFRLEPGQWTDDTSMALCLADSIVTVGGMDLADQLRRYVRWRDEGLWSSTGRCFDIGGTTSRQLLRFDRTGEAVDPAPNDDEAANGSLMRLAPAPIAWHRSVAEAAERSGETSRTTHAARRPVDCCRLYGAMVAAVIGGATLDEVLAPTFWQWGDLHPQVAAIAAGSARSASRAPTRARSCSSTRPRARAGPWSSRLAWRSPARGRGERLGAALVGERQRRAHPLFHEVHAIPAIPAEALVAAVAGERDRDVLAREKIIFCIELETANIDLRSDLHRRRRDPPDQREHESHDQACAGTDRYHRIDQIASPGQDAARLRATDRLATRKRDQISSVSDEALQVRAWWQLGRGIHDDGHALGMRDLGDLLEG